MDHEQSLSRTTMELRIHVVKTEASAACTDDDVSVSVVQAGS